MNLLRAIIRLPLRWIPDTAELPILIGKLHGKKWIFGSGVPRQWIGFYEMGQVNLFAKFCKKGNVIYDIGAHVGYYSLLGASLVGEEGIVYAFEPLPQNIHFLEIHQRINSLTNLRIFKYAVSDQAGETYFELGPSNFQGFLSHQQAPESLLVTTISLDEFFKAYQLRAPDTIKIDVEGAEYQVLMGAKQMLDAFHPVIFLSLHEKLNPGVSEKCFTYLQNLGYRIDKIKNESHDEVIAQPVTP